MFTKIPVHVVCRHTLCARPDPSLCLLLDVQFVAGGPRL